MLKKTFFVLGILHVLLCLSLQRLSAQNSLVGYWPLDEGKGTRFAELSGHSKPAIAADTVKWVKTDRGNALQFSPQTKSYVHIPTSSAWDYAPGNVGDITISFWVKVDGPGFIISHYFGGIPGAWGFFTRGNSLMFSTYFDREDWGKDAKSANVIFNGFRFGKWQFVSLVWKRGKQGWVKGYLNGKLVGKAENVPLTSSLIKSTLLGSRSREDMFFTGNLRDLSIHDRALSAEDVKGLYSKGIELSSSVVVTSLVVDRILYKTAETCVADFRIRNTTTQEQTVELTASLITDLDRTMELIRKKLTLKAHESRTFREQYPVKDLDFGCEIRVAVSQNGKLLSRKQEFFQVSDNFWRVGIGGGFGSALHTGDKRDKTLAVPDLAMEKYINIIEFFFWAPCDWALHVPRTKQWWSGQAGYPEDRDVLKKFIKEAHQRGIRVIMYASSNPAGPFGWEAARQHPDWFMDRYGRFPTLTTSQVESLINWNNPQWRKTHTKSLGWIKIPVDLRNPQALDYGIDALINGVKFFGWNGVRFDGHYTITGYDDISTRNMRRLKERVQSDIPGFHLGFNYGRSPEWRGSTHEMREAMAGGGMYLQEGIRNWRYITKPYESWKHYATNELRIAKLIQGWGGYYHCMWECALIPKEQRFYKFVYGLIAGGHPATYSGSVPYCPNWGAFMTRWSRFLWDPDLKKINDVSRFTVKPANRIYWQPLVQECVVSENKKYVVLHLVNPSPTDQIQETQIPEPIRNVSVGFTPKNNEKIREVFMISPDRIPAEKRLKPDEDGVVKISELNLWVMVVYELQGQYQVPKRAPLFTEKPDERKITEALRSKLVSRIFDPNKDAESVNQDPDTRIWETDKGMNGIGAMPGNDKDALNGQCQVNTVKNMKQGHSKHFMGHTWLGPIRPGKYRVTYRLKWEPGKNGAGWKVHFYITDIKAKRDVVKRTYDTPGYRGMKEKVMDTLQSPGEYHDYSFEFLKEDPGCINANCIVDTDKQDGGQKIYMDYVKTELIEPVPDTKLAVIKSKQTKAGSKTDKLSVDTNDLLAELENDVKRETLPSPNGRQPARFLLVKGLYANVYDVAKVAKTDVAYELPGKAEDLFKYDCVILANADMTFSSFEQRQVLKEFVEKGGRLVVLGGISTFGNGSMTYTYLEDMMQIKMKGQNEVVKCDELMGPEKGKPYPDKPMVFWKHDIRFGEKAKILAYAGTAPLAGKTSFGKGSVFIFTGTVLGDPRQGQTPFWKTESWSAILKRMVKGE